MISTENSNFRFSQNMAKMRFLPITSKIEQLGLYNVLTTDRNMGILHLLKQKFLL